MNSVRTRESRDDCAATANVLVNKYLGMDVGEIGHAHSLVSKHDGGSDHSAQDQLNIQLVLVLPWRVFLTSNMRRKYSGTHASVLWASKAFFGYTSFRR